MADMMVPLLFQGMRPRRPLSPVEGDALALLRLQLSLASNLSQKHSHVRRGPAVPTKKRQQQLRTAYEWSCISPVTG